MDRPFMSREGSTSGKEGLMLTRFSFSLCSMCHEAFVGMLFLSMLSHFLLLLPQVLHIQGEKDEATGIPATALIGRSGSPEHLSCLCPCHLRPSPMHGFRQVEALRSPAQEVGFAPRRDWELQGCAVRNIGGVLRAVDWFALGDDKFSLLLQGGECAGRTGRDGSAGWQLGRRFDGPEDCQQRSVVP